MILNFHAGCIPTEVKKNCLLSLEINAWPRQLITIRALKNVKKKKSEERVTRGNKVIQSMEIMRLLIVSSK